MRALRLLLFTSLALLTGAVCAAEPARLPDTQPLTMSGDLSVQMHEAALRDMDATIAGSVQSRQRFWQRDLSSPQKYHESIRENRARFQQIIGLSDQRQPVVLERFGSDEAPAVVADTDRYTITQVRWNVLDRITAEGLLLEPKGQPHAWIVAVPDADQTPEQITGLAAGVPAESQFARRFVENGFCVLVPTLISRSDEGSGNPAILMTNQPHREWIHRQAYMMGKHLIGFEVQKVLAAVDYFHQRRGLDSSLAQTNIGLAGYGEGGLLALYSAAVDPRIDAVLVSGFFKSRQQTWQEPIYRNVWGLLREFGDAEIASLIAPRGLVIEYSEEPLIDGPPPVREGRKNCAAPGRLTTPAFQDVADELKRLDRLVSVSFQRREFIHGPNGALVPYGSPSALVALAAMLGAPSPMPLSEMPPVDRRQNFNPMDRQLRQVRELDDHIQSLVRDSDQVRDKFFLYKVMPEFANVRWNYELQFPVKQQEKFVEAAREYRQRFWEEVIGKLEDPLPALNPRSRKIMDEPTWTGYEVVLDVGKEGFAWGILCVPKSIPPGEKRPVVVCQHGRHGEPPQVIEGDVPAYRNFAARLAERGFITLAPHNLYQREEHYRTLSRKGNTVKASMFSVMLRHHQQWLSWLQTLPEVDARRIGFYGLSYGGESAVRIPPVLDGYALSICSGDFNDWTRKVASTHDRKSFMFTDEWEMPYFNMGSTFSYAELTYLMFPRPFMVERGHHDGVSVDSWVASEYAKTRWFYDQFGLGDRTEIEFFNGGHAINGQGTFDFLHKHLHWPKP